MAAATKRVFALPEKLKENKDYYRYSPYSKSILAVLEDCLFIWHAVEEHILVVTLKEPKTTEDREPQILTLSSVPAFTVEELTFNPCGHLLALSGKNGLSVVELPRRWGRTHFYGTGFEGGKDTVLCKSWRIAQRFLSCNTRVQVCRVAWYPGCTTGMHLLVLCTDNCLRMYDVTEPQSPVTCIRISSKGSNPGESLELSSESRLSFPYTAAALGETAVSFDFGPAQAPESELEDPQNEIWPIFILKGNGDVCLINSNIRNMRGRGPSVQGPLSMHPPAEDNYGVDACSIACLQTTPPILIVSTCAGILYHCIALQSSSGEQSDHSPNRQIEDSWIPLNERDDSIPDMELYVYECIELSITLTQPGPEDELFSCPIRILPDPSVNFRYHCTHSAGVHAVLLSVIPDMEKFIGQDELSVTADSLLDLFDSPGQESIVEHLVCTQPFPSLPGSPVLGLAVSSTTLGASLVCLTSSWDAMVLPLGYSCLHHICPLPSNELHPDHSETKIPDKEGDSFLTGLLTSFHGVTNTPLLKTDHTATEPLPQKCIELLSNVTQSLREDRIQRLHIAHAQMQKRVKMLQTQKLEMISDLELIGGEQEILRDNAEALAEKYEDISHRQEQITKKLECALSLLERRMPVLSDSEVAMQKELFTIEDRLKHLDNLMEQVHLKMRFKTDVDSLKKERSEENNRQAAGDLAASNQLKHVKDLVTQQGASISNLVKKVNIVMKEMGV